MSGMSLYVLCEIYLFILTFFHLVPPSLIQPIIGALILGSKGPPAAGGIRQTSISDYSRLHNIYSCTQMLVFV